MRPSTNKTKLTERDLAFIAMFTGVIAALGIVPAFTPPGFSVPITAQSLGVMLAGGILDYRAMTGLPAVLREALTAELPILAGRVVERRQARDGTTKLLLEFPPRGGRAATVELVHMPARRSGSASSTARSPGRC